MKKIDIDEWNANLVPYKKFFEKFGSEGPWTARREYVIPRSIQTRIRITVEAAPFEMALDCGRHDSLAEQGIYDGDIDAVEFADDLMETLFQETSPREMYSIVDALKKFLDDWEAK